MSGKELLFKKYRRELYGIKAFAILFILLNNLNKNIFPGGYLGIDILLLISGYAITFSVYKKTFSNFWIF